MPSEVGGDMMSSAIGDAPSDDAPVAGIAASAAASDDDSGDDEGGLQAERPAIKNSTREFARRIAEAHKNKIAAGDGLGLAPVIGTAPSAPSEAAKPQGQPPAAAAPTPPVVDKAPPAELVSAWEAVNAARAQMEADKASIAKERERLAGFGKGKLLGSADDMHAAMSAWLRDEIGEGASDEDIKDAMADVITELSLKISGVTLPDSAKSAAETKRALRIIKKHNRDQERERQEAKDRAEREEQRRKRTSTADLIGQEIAKAASHPFLSATTDIERDGMTPGEFVMAVIEERWKHDRSTLSWQEAAKLADNHFKSEAERQHKRWSPLLTQPDSGGGAAQAQGAHQGGRSAQVPRTLRNADASEPIGAPEPDLSGKWDPDEHRRRTANRWNGKIGRRAE